MSAEKARSPNLNQSSRLFSHLNKPAAPATPNPVSPVKSPIPKPSAPVKSPTVATKSSASPGAISKSPAIPAKSSVAKSPGVTKSGPAKNQQKAKDSGAKQDALSNVVSASPAAAKKPTFSRMVMCYCCGQQFSVHSIAKHEPKCREKRPHIYKSLTKLGTDNKLEIEIPAIPDPPSLPLPTDKDDQAVYETYNNTAYEIWKNHLVTCPYGCGRKYDPDRIGVHLRGCSLRPKPPPKSEEQEVNEEPAHIGDNEDEGGDERKEKIEDNRDEEEGVKNGEDEDEERREDEELRERTDDGDEEVQQQDEQGEE